jgi:hypothetical protein
MQARDQKALRIGVEMASDRRHELPLHAVIDGLKVTTHR